MWERLTLDDIDRAGKNLEAHRAEVLAKQAEELKALEIEAAEIEALDETIDAFVRQYRRRSADAAGAAPAKEHPT